MSASHVFNVIAFCSELLPSTVIVIHLCGERGGGMKLFEDKVDVGEVEEGEEEDVDEEPHALD